MLEILRPKNCVLAGLGAVISFLLVSPPDVRIIPIFFSIALMTGAGNAINDFFDYELDAKNKPDRPIPSGRVSRNGALSVSVFLFALSTSIASLLSQSTLIIAFFVSALLVVYPFKLKQYKLAGNIIVSTLVASLFFFGASVVRITFPVFVLSLCSFFANLAREIVKDIEDFSQPEKNTLPKIIGKRHAALVATGFLLLIFPLGVLPDFSTTYFTLIFSSYFVFLLSISDLLSEHYTLASSRIKTGMAVALLAFASTLL